MPYALAGNLWYQGESDYANRGYLRQIEAMAESWRRLFARGEVVVDVSAGSREVVLPSPDPGSLVAELSAESRRHGDT